MRIKTITLLLSAVLLINPSVHALTQPNKLGQLKSAIENYKLENFGEVRYLSEGDKNSLYGNYRYNQRITFAPGYYRSSGDFYNFETYRNLNFIGSNGRIFYTRGALAGTLSPYAYGSDGYLNQLIENNQLPPNNNKRENMSWYELGLEGAYTDYIKLLKDNFESEIKNSLVNKLKDEIYFPEEKSIITFNSSSNSFYITTKDKFYSYHLTPKRLHFSIKSLDNSYRYDLTYNAKSVREYLPLNAKILK